MHNVIIARLLFFVGLTVAIVAVAVGWVDGYHNRPYGTGVVVLCTLLGSGGLLSTIVGCLQIAEIVGRSNSPGSDFH